MAEFFGAYPLNGLFHPRDAVVPSLLGRNNEGLGVGLLAHLSAMNGMGIHDHDITWFEFHA